MPRIKTGFLQKKLLTYGIISTLCCNVLDLSLLHSVEEVKERSLVILEGGQGNSVSGANLHQKVQFLTILANEQAVRIRTLREEVQSLKSKLHLAQLAAFSEEKGNYREIYAALKRERAQNKDTQNQLEKMIFQLKKENEEESQKNDEAKDHIISLMTALESQAFALEKIREEYQQGLIYLSSSTNEANNYKQLYIALEQEAAQYTETQNQLEKLIQQLKAENEAEKQKIEEAEAHVAALTIALKEQTFAIEKIEEDYKNHSENLSLTTEEANKYKILYAALDQEFTQNKETQKQLDQLIQQMKVENETEKQKISNAEAYIDSLLAALNEQTITLESIQHSHKNQIEQLSTVLDEAEYDKAVRATLDHELSQTKDAQIQLEQLILQLKDENESAKQKISDAEIYINALIDALDIQTLAMESMQQDHRKKVEQIVVSTETQNYRQLAEILETEYINNLLAFEEEQQNFLQKYQELAFNFEKAQQQTIHQAQVELAGIYSALEEEKILAHLTEHMHSHLLGALEMHLRASQEASDNLKYLADAFETAYLQHQFTINHAEIEKEESVQKLLADLNEERAKAMAIQKNLDQVQQIHDQTIKLYNELYIDHKSSQKQFENIQRELDERKMNHLVETDDLEIKIDSLNHEFKKELERHNLELDKRQLAAVELEELIQKLLHENEAQNVTIHAKKEEIRHLTDQIAHNEVEIKQQFQQLTANLEKEKYKNDELQKTLEDHHIFFTFNQKNLEASQQELENLKNDLALKDEHFLLEKIEKEDLCDRLKQMNEQKSKLILHLQMLDEKQNSEMTMREQQKLETENIVERFMLSQSENQKLNQEVTDLKKQLNKFQDNANDSEMKIMALQLERLQEALQQVINEKTALQSQYQNQLINENMLSERLEQALKELKQYKPG